MAAGQSLDSARWAAGLNELLGRIAVRFGRVEPRRRAKAFVLGLLGDPPRKNGWTLAEHAGDDKPPGNHEITSSGRMLDGESSIYPTSAAQPRLA